MTSLQFVAATLRAISSRHNTYTIYWKNIGNFPASFVFGSGDFISFFKQIKRCLGRDFLLGVVETSCFCKKLYLPSRSP